MPSVTDDTYLGLLNTATLCWGYTDLGPFEFWADLLRRDSLAYFCAPLLLCSHSWVTDCISRSIRRVFLTSFYHSTPYLKYSSKQYWAVGFVQAVFRSNPKFTKRRIVRRSALQFVIRAPFLRSMSLSLSLSLSLSVSLTQSLSLILSLIHTLSLSFFPSLSHTHTHSHTLSLSLTQIHTPDLSFSLSLSCSYTITRTNSLLLPH